MTSGFKRERLEGDTLSEVGMPKVLETFFRILPFRKKVVPEPALPSAPCEAEVLPPVLSHEVKKYVSETVGCFSGVRFWALMRDPDSITIGEEHHTDLCLKCRTALQDVQKMRSRFSRRRNLRRLSHHTRLR